MSIKVTVENPIDARIRLRARKTLDGNILVIDHPDMDIVVSPKENKVLALSKTQYGDHVYAAQSRLFEYLAKHGVIKGSSIHGGNVFGSLEGVILESTDSKKVDPIQMTLYVLTHFLLEEKPHYDALHQYEQDFEKELLEPDPYTPLGKIPHEKRKGVSVQYPGYSATYGMYGYVG
tara:strand:+ start:234 stop:761 length:528 start_codon:yes stop_codon:yes gene_type:complete